MSNLMLRMGGLTQEFTELISRCEHCKEQFTMMTAGNPDAYWEWEKVNKGRCVA